MFYGLVSSCPRHHFLSSHFYSSKDWAPVDCIKPVYLTAPHLKSQTKPWAGGNQMDELSSGNHSWGLRVVPAIWEVFEGLLCSCGLMKCQTKLGPLRVPLLFIFQIRILPPHVISTQVLGFNSKFWNLEEGIGGIVLIAMPCLKVG